MEGTVNSPGNEAVESFSKEYLAAQNKKDGSEANVKFIH